MPKYWLDGIFDEEENNTPTIFLCVNYKYCSDKQCLKQHWYKSEKYIEDVFLNEKDTLNKAVKRYKENGVNIVIN
jgi:hypothetical protein